MSRGHAKHVREELLELAAPDSQETQLVTADADGVVTHLAPFVTPERLARIEKVLAHRTLQLQVAVEGLSDPHNVAAVMRTADAMGVLRVHVVGQERFCSRASVTQGAHKWLDVRFHRSPAELARWARATGCCLWVADMDGAVPVDAVPVDDPVIIVLGNESTGISPEMRAVAQGAFHIPMVGFVESMNVSVAAAVAMAVLRRKVGDGLPPEDVRAWRARYYLRSVRAGQQIAARFLRGQTGGASDSGAPRSVDG